MQRGGNISSILLITCGIWVRIPCVNRNTVSRRSVNVRFFADTPKETLQHKGVILVSWYNNGLVVRLNPHRPTANQTQDNFRKHLFTFCVYVSGAFHEDYLILILSLHVGVDEFNECFRLTVGEAVVGADYQSSRLLDAFNF